jgi:transposase
VKVACPVRRGAWGNTPRGNTGRCALCLPLLDLERHRVVDLLRDREPATISAWLRQHPEITAIARDRGREYARGIELGLPEATPVADRFQLLGTLREAIERSLLRLRPELRTLLEDAEVSADHLARSDGPPPPQYDPGPARGQIKAAKHAERERRFQAVKDAHRRGLNQRQIAQECEVSVATVRPWLAADQLPPERRG